MAGNRQDGPSYGRWDSNLHASEITWKSWRILDKLGRIFSAAIKYDPGSCYLALPTKSREELLGLLGEAQDSDCILNMFKDAAGLSMVMWSHTMLSLPWDEHSPSTQLRQGGLAAKGRIKTNENAFSFLLWPSTISELKTS